MEHIIKSFLAKEEAGIREIFEQTYPFVYARAKCLQKKEEDAYKLMREVYLALQQDKQLTVSNIYQLLAETTYSLGCQKYRKKKVREASYIEFDKQNYYAPKNQNDDQINEIILDSLEELPDMYQATLYAFYMDGMKISDLARVFHYNESTIMNRLNYTHKYIQKSMEYYQEEQKVKLQFSAESIQRAMNVWARETVMSAAAAQAVYISICRDLSVAVDGNVVNENKESFKSDITMEILIEELERHMKKEGMNKKKIAVIAGIVVVACVLGGIIFWTISQKKPDNNSEDVKDTPKVEADLSDENHSEESEPEGTATGGSTSDETVSNETTSDETVPNETTTNEGNVEQTQETGEYLLPTSNTEKLTDDDLIGLSKEQLKLARNEIFARHGLIFGVEELDQYFAQKSWYQPKFTLDEFYDEVEMNLTEEYNVRFIAAKEQS